MEKLNSMENATIVVNMVIELMNAKRNQNLRASVTNARNKVTRHQNVDLSSSSRENCESNIWLGL